MPRDRGRKGENNPLEVAEEKRAKTARRRSGCWRSDTMMLLGRMRWVKIDWVQPGAWRSVELLVNCGLSPTTEQLQRVRRGSYFIRKHRTRIRLANIVQKLVE